MKRLAHFITPAGALMAMGCFFLPWIETSCSGEVIRMKGPDTESWSVFVAAASVLIVWVMARVIDEFKLEMLSVLVLSALGAGIMLWKYLSALRDGEGSWAFVSDPGFTLKYGFFGTLAGFVIAAAGAFYKGRPKADTPPPPR